MDISAKQAARTKRLAELDAARRELVARHMGKAVSDITPADRAEAAAIGMSLPNIPVWLKVPARTIVR